MAQSKQSNQSNWSRIVLAALTHALAVGLVSCAANNPSGNGSPNDGAGTVNEQSRSWQTVALDEGADIVPAGCSPRPGRLLEVKSSGVYRLEGCNGRAEGNLSKEELERVSQQTEKVLVSDLSTRSCAQFLPQAPATLTITRSNGDAVPVLEAGPEMGECTRGDGNATRDLKQTLNEIYEAHEPDHEH